MKKRAAVYLRVSRGEQSIENQRPDVLRLVRTRKLKLSGTYAESASAVKTRPQLERLLRDAHVGAFDVLVVWSLDRLGRSMVGNLQVVLDLDRCGVQVISVREPWLDTGGPVRSLLIAIFGWVAEQERAQIVARTKAGIERARRRGIRIGRPERAIDLRTARALRAQGLPLREVAKRMKVPRTTLHRALQRPDPVPKRGSRGGAAKSAKR